LNSLANLRMTDTHTVSVHFQLTNFLVAISFICCFLSQTMQTMPELHCVLKNFVIREDVAFGGIFCWMLHGEAVF